MRIFVWRMGKRGKLYFCLLLSALVVLSTLSVMRVFHKSGIFVIAGGPKPIFCGDPGEKEIALTCNVAWGNENIEPMLAILEKENVKMTFFLEGRWAKNNPELVQKIAQSGHELGNHSYTHPHPKHLSKVQNQEQIRKTESVIKQITGISTNLYAPPYGEWDEEVVKAADELGYYTIMWSVDTIDWRREGAEVIAKRVLQKHHNGAIILMHPIDQTVEALPIILKELKKEGYTFVTVSQMVNRLKTLEK